jgi:hypothetical protein
VAPVAVEIVASVAPVQTPVDALAAPKKPRAPSTRAKAAPKKAAVDGGSEGSSEPVAE